MKTRPSQFLPCLLLIGLALLLATPQAHAAESVSVRATLILGTNDGGGVDRQLRQYERNLKRVLPFNTFTQQGSGSASVTPPGEARISIGGGQAVHVKVENAGEGKFRIAARWTRGEQSYINTTVVASPDRPTVLVGPSAQGGKLILLLVAK